MCEECGCNNIEPESTDERLTNIDRSIHEVNNRLAHDIWHALQNKNILCINIMGSPGSGKTTLIENLARHIKPQQLFVIQGDLESDIDTKRLKAAGIDSYQINTHSGCHLNAMMINKALLKINLTGKKYLIIENVGNLVCPAEVKIGQHLNLLTTSTTEGSDKPKKYPYIFHDSQLIVITKYDLIEHIEFDQSTYLDEINLINPKATIVKTTNSNQESFKPIAEFLEHEHSHLLKHEHSH